MENWRVFLKENSEPIGSTINYIKKLNLDSCYKINSKLTNNYTKHSRLECIGIGTDKFVFIDSQKPGFVLKFEKLNPVKEYSTMETAVWKYLRNTPFKNILAPIEETDDGYYYMQLGSGIGEISEIKQKLFEIANKFNLDFNELEYYFLSDANSSNIRKVQNSSFLIDYDDSWPWVFKNKQLIKKL
jgi:hypothetical protein